ncbi:3-methyl-2-oxobutanoate hydroxymethyltransferase [Flocculibacter collagenilyticus]|uniref:3-methyl-2-oxobutanoate hydroxymethyltransferase n=1 Tax=Flocculibacter collagenilyticus TaxID=2744479 RepID=UPI0018F7A599|nr:3-methyl-2-oxobutanoate hydroxymethyltransferase [Flocculibacter collagenilyticus]
MAKITVSKLLKMKQQSEKIAAITAYDASFAQIFDQAGMHVILVGDSLGMVLQGHKDTLPVTVEHIAYHTRSVAAGVENTFVMADMPFMSYATTEDAYKNAAILMQAGANMVKLEGGDWLYDTIAGLTRNGIPVCAHLGLTPQSVHVFGGFKVQGRKEEQANQMIEHAKSLEKAGAQLLVLECVPVALAKRITDGVSIPTIGIGAGRDTDGQILVMHDFIGISTGYIPKFSKNYLDITGNIPEATELFIKEVQDSIFPEDERSFD